MPVNHLDVLVPFACLLGAAVAQTPGVLVDINQTGSGPIDSSPLGFARLGSLVLFSATTQARGAELWAADLTTNAVYLLADIAPGTASSAPADLVAMGGRVYFVADDGVHGRELWSSDGTPAGTQIVVDLAPGGSSSARDLVVAGSRLFFSAYTPVGNELVVSDGTAIGTQVIDINPSGHSLPSNLTVIQNEVWFRATTPALGSEPWRSDGTPGGTVLVADTVTGASGGFGDSFTPVGNRVLFVANASVWTSDGTAAGTSVLLQGSQKLLGAGGFAYLMLSGSIYRSGGTVANTVQVASVPVQMFEQVTQFTPFGAHFVIRVQGGLAQVDSTWLSDGTALGTVHLPGIAMQSWVADGNMLWFGSSSGDGAGNELWRTDGTLAGTTRIADIVPGPGHSTPQALAVIAPGEVMFSADTATGREPWRSLGFALGTFPIANIALEVTQSANPAEVVDAAGRLFFRAWDGTVETLWTSDGTAAGTHAVVPAGPNQPLSIDSVVGLGDRVFFRGRTAASGSEVMVTDGTAAGTHAIDTWPGPDSSNPSVMIAAADRLYFLSFTPSGSRSLWQTDGAVTVSISAPIAVGTIAAVGAFGRGAVFAFNNPLAGVGSEPWYTDGTVAGTLPLGDLLPGLDSSEPSNIVAFGGRCYFTARNALGSSKQLWVTDGTAAGTQLFFAGVPGAPTHFDRLAVVRDKLFFAGRDTAHGLELWVSDGTQAGSHLVLDSVPGPSGFTPFEPRSFGDLLLYRVAATGLQGLWRSDGTAANVPRCDLGRHREARYRRALRVVPRVRRGCRRRAVAHRRHGGRHGALRRPAAGRWLVGAERPGAVERTPLLSRRARSARPRAVGARSRRDDAADRLRLRLRRRSAVAAVGRRSCDGHDGDVPRGRGAADRHQRGAVHPLRRGASPARPRLRRVRRLQPADPRRGAVPGRRGHARARRADQPGARRPVVPGPGADLERHDGARARAQQRAHADDRELTASAGGRAGSRWQHHSGLPRNRNGAQWKGSGYFPRSAFFAAVNAASLSVSPASRRP